MPPAGGGGGAPPNPVDRYAGLDARTVIKYTSYVNAINKSKIKTTFPIVQVASLER